MFQDFARKHVLYLHVTSGVKGDKLQTLPREKGSRGWPHLVFLDAEGTLLTEVRCNRDGRTDLRMIVQSGDLARAMLVLRARAAMGEPGVRYEYLLNRILLRQVTASQVRKRLASIAGLSDVRRRRIEALIVDVEIREVLAEFKGAEAGARFAEMKSKGRRPAQEGRSYWTAIIEFAERQGDVELFGEALLELHEQFPSNKINDTWLNKYEERLNRLKRK